MKKILAILLSLLTLLSCGLLSACSAEKTQPDTPDTEAVWETVSEAYIYAFPLVLTDATKTLSTNTDGTMTGRAPINQFNHAKKLADGVTRVDVPTATMWSITRTVLSGNEDLPNVYAIQEQMQLLPLSAYVQGGEYAAPQGAYKEENDFVPVNKVLSMTPAEFFNTANALMQVNPPADADEELLKKLSAINVGAGKTFDAALLGEGAAERWTQMLQGLRATLAADGAKYAQKLGQWIYYGKPIGDFGTEYTYRAMVALVGLGANTVDVAIYPKTTVDENGAALTGEKKYTLHFETLPPTLEGGFWSVTAYGEDDFLIDNSIDRYCINDRSDFKLNADGTLDIILSKDAPEDTSNWLPVSDGEFHLFMRIYVPDMTALDSWQPPVIREQ